MAVSGSKGAEFTPIAVTGYNEDIVVEAGGAHPGALTGATTATMETGTNNTQNTWYEAGYVPWAPATGLPAAGSTITNLSAPDHRYLLASSYAGNNAALLSSTTPAATLKPSSPASFPGLSFLTAAGNGPVTIGCSIHHSDGSVETNFFTSPDWVAWAPTAFIANGRVNVSSATLSSLITNNPKLYASDIPLANTTSPVTSIGLTFAGGSASANVAIFALSGGSSSLSLTGDDFNANSEAAVQMLLQWYNGSGLWNSTGWWNAANCVEAVENVIVANHDLQYLSVLTNTFNLNAAGSFLNDYYDDEGWWANAWIRAYDLTGNTAFLNMAKTIFSDLAAGWDTTNTLCPGGIWWNKSRGYKNAIPNELFLLAAIRLHQRTPGDGGTGSYFYWATNEWAWFKASGMINAQNLVNDGLNGCANNGQTTWTYNQGVIHQVLGIDHAAGFEPRPLVSGPIEIAADPAVARRSLVQANGCQQEEFVGNGILVTMGLVPPNAPRAYGVGRVPTNGEIAEDGLGHVQETGVAGEVVSAYPGVGPPTLIIVIGI